MEKFIPDGSTYMIIDLTDEPKYVYHNETLAPIMACKKAWFSGLRTEPITIPSSSGCEMIVINFHKGKALPFLKNPMSEVTNHVVDAEQVLNVDILAIRDAVLEQPSPAGKCQFIENALVRHYYKQLLVNPFVDYAVSRIIESPQKLSLKMISEKVGYSQKHIIKLFKDHVGVVPKEFLKIIRFQKAVNDLEIVQQISWASLAADCGYYDQSHFISDFKVFSGFTPTEYMKSKGDDLNYIPVH